MDSNCSTSDLCEEMQYLTIDDRQKVPSQELEGLVNNMVGQLQDAFERPLTEREHQDVSRAFTLMNYRTSGTKLPRLFQMLATLEVLNGKNLVVRAGTGSGKSIAMALPMLLRPEWIFVTIVPLLALQNQHVSFVSSYSLYNV